MFWKIFGRFKEVRFKLLFYGVDLREVYGGLCRVFFLDERSSVRSGFNFENK